MKTIKSLIVATALFAAGFTASANASLIGDTISANGVFLGPSSATVGAGVEFSGVFNYINFDFDANTLTITPTSWVGWSGFGTYTFSDFDSTVTSFNLLSNTGFSGGLVTNYSFSAHSISMDFDLGSSNGYDAAVVFGLTTSNAPEPSSLMMIGLGLLGLGFARKRATK